MSEHPINAAPEHDESESSRRVPWFAVVSALVDRTTRTSRVPLTVTDPVVLARVAALIAEATHDAPAQPKIPREPARCRPGQAA